MLWTIARREIVDVVRDGRFRWATVIVGALLIVALLAGWKAQRDVSADHASAERLARAQWLAQAPKDPHSAAHYGSYAFKPRGPLTLFDSGVNAYTGVAAWLEAHKQNEFQFRPAQDQSSVARFGELTAAATLQFLMPVLIMLQAFARFSGEREDGTLRQIVAAGVPRRMLAAGKVVGVGLALAVVLVPAAIVGAIAILLASGGAGLQPTIGRMALLAVVYVAYFVVMLTIALAASAVARSSSQALALLIAFWIVNAVLAPRMASDVARRLDPTPTAFAFAEAVERDTYDGLTVHQYNLRRARDLRRRLLEEHGVTRVEDLPINFRGADYLEREAHSNQIWDDHYGRLWRSFEAQVRTHQLAGFAAPLLAVRSMSMSLAGADFFHHQHFAVAAESYRRRQVELMNSNLAHSATSAQLGYVAGADLWSRLPAFEYHAPGPGWAIARVTWSLVALGLWVIAGLVALAWAVRVMPVD
jgi:ABC-2 type transport system permease protein